MVLSEPAGGGGLSRRQLRRADSAASSVSLQVPRLLLSVETAAQHA
jgi:hypothetical protein